MLHPEIHQLHQLESPVQIQIKPKSQFEFVLRVPGSMSFWMWWIFGGVKISEETVEFLFEVDLYLVNLEKRRAQ